MSNIPTMQENGCPQKQLTGKTLFTYGDYTVSLEYFVENKDNIYITYIILYNIYNLYNVYYRYYII